MTIRRRRGERIGSAYAAAYLAASYLGRDKLTEAEALLNEAMSDCAALADRRGMAHCHFYFGHLEERRGNRTAALEQWRRAQELAATIPIPALELQTLIALLRDYTNAGQVGNVWTTSIRLLRNLRQQQLGPMAAWRLLIRFHA